MIPGLEYEPPHGYNTASPSVQSVEISPQHQSDYHHGQQLHRRRPHANGHSQYNSYNDNDGGDGKYAKKLSAKTVKKLDFFPKMERDYEVRTERGGQATLVGYVIMLVLILAEFWTWRGLNGESLEHIVVDTRYVGCVLFSWLMVVGDGGVVCKIQSAGVSVLSGRSLNVPMKNTLCVIVLKQILHLLLDDILTNARHCCRLKFLCSACERRILCICQ
jgi:hypothetical protein